ncbi:MAG: ATP-dependent RNA helicase dbp7 [Geoglossum umbratile]|nr:MAG: ATP-dependent RNA helicase dbp7 [Geoglossum umbratile]
MEGSDDTLLLNFSLGDGPLNAPANFKGGRWRDRVTAKYGARYRQKKLAARLNSATTENPSNERVSEPGKGRGGPTDADNTSRQAKRRRMDELDQRPQAIAERTATYSRPGETPGKPHQVISSLFSFNPAPRITAGEGPDDTAPVEPSNAPLIDGLSTFTTLGLSPTLSAHLLLKLRLKAPTAIQKAVIPELIKDDSDAFIQAETGSGKTLAYLLPIVQRIMNSAGNATRAVNLNGDGKVHRDSGLFAIILSPTRELCRQISVVLEGLLRCAHWIVAGTVIGGEKKKSEKARLRKGLNILVATPGRLADHLDNTEALDVSNIRWLVLDEGDRLMELGFEAEIQGIVEKIEKRSRLAEAGVSLGRLPRRKITVLCSATMKMSVQRLGELSLKEAVHLKADPSGGGERDNHYEDNFSAPAQLKQSYAVVPAKLRLVTLVAVLKRAFIRRGSVMKAIVFISCADSVDFHFQVLGRQVIDAEKSVKPNARGELVDKSKLTSASKEKITEDNQIGNSTVAPAAGLSIPGNQVMLHKLHGSLPQSVRTSTLAAFTQSKDPAILICTDVASRGLDLPNVDFVIEYDPPFSKDDHLHRVGRTARAGRDGRALIYLLPGDEEGYVEILKEGYRDGGKGLRCSNVEELLKRGFGSPGLGAGKDWEERATGWQLEVERWALEDPKHLEMARRAYQSHVRAYATHVASERDIFDIKNLHLGHLAKAFALRDKPGSIKVPGARGSKESKKMRKQDSAMTKTSRSTGEEGNHLKSGHGGAMADPIDVAKMKAKMKEHMAGISEFNIG